MIQNQGDYESILEQRAREMQMEWDLGVVPRVGGVKAVLHPILP